MSLGHGTNIVKEGLAFYYDIANTQKSWLGEPTTNLVLSPKSITTGYAAQAGVTRLDNQLLNFDNTFTAGSLSNSGWIAYTSASTTNGNRYTASWYVKAGTTTSCSFTWGGAHQGNRTDFTFNLLTGQITNLSQAAGEDYNATALKNGWWRVWYSSTLSSGNAFYPQLNNGSGTMYVGGLQIEQKPYATRGIVIGTRSTSQALRDMINSVPLVADTLAFTSGDIFEFNGTTSVLRPTITHDYKLSSCLEVIFRSVDHNTGFRTIFGYSHNSGYSLPTIGSLYLSGNNLHASVITASQVYRTVVSSGTFNTNQLYHVFLNKDTTNGVLQIYVNGVLTGSQTFDASTYAQWPSIGSFIGSNILDIGKSTNTNSAQGWAADFFSGQIYLAKVYNRVLSLQEIQQNFEALRGRYGI
jgi:hypothetical protein